MSAHVCRVARPCADIAPPHGAPVRPFFIDAATHTPFDVANKLWAAIGEAHGV